MCTLCSENVLFSYNDFKVRLAIVYIPFFCTELFAILFSFIHAHSLTAYFTWETL